MLPISSDECNVKWFLEFADDTRLRTQYGNIIKAS